MTSEGDEDLTPQNRRQLQRVINVGCATTFSILAGGVVYAIVFRRKQAKYGGETTFINLDRPGNLLISCLHDWHYQLWGGGGALGKD